MPDISQFEDFCEWGDDRVYLLMAITRQNENEGMTANDREVHRTVVREEEELEGQVEKLRQFYSDSPLTFRLYLSINARNVMKAYFEFQGAMDEWLRMRLNGNEGVKRKFKKLDSEFKSILQTPECKDDRFFLFDIDTEEKEFIDSVRGEIGESQILLEQETPNGHHIITAPNEYSVHMNQPTVELKRDGMVFLGYL